MARVPGTPPPTNRLAGETSPYLLQHAHNPVDWYPWGPAALSRAKLLDRPVFLSVGYAACHWCHVMERESFEDEATAALLNDGFVAIKVDREERPDIDQLYMGAVQAMTGQGGWPMSVFLTPDGRPFYGGTYFPDTPRHGMPSFRQVLEGVRRAWIEQRAEIEQSGSRLVEAMVRAQAAEGGARVETAEAGEPVAGAAAAEAILPAGRTAMLEEAADRVAEAFDPVHGGWGSAPKFPQPMTIEFLLRRHIATGERRWLTIALRSLEAMADGGVHDQLGGGFHRYSTDAAWLVPHFEQMLYDNAQLGRVYAHAWALTGEPGMLATTISVLDYLLRELRTEDGGFAASQDADTDGVEGATFTWGADELHALLGDAYPLFAAAYGVTDAGNWEGRTVLSRVADDATLGGRFGLAPDEVGRRLAEARATLLAARSKRAQPARDDKVLAAWNGLAIAALADAARLLRAAGESGLSERGGRYVEAARAAARGVLAGLVTSDGRLRRSWKDGRATADGVLEDHACLAEGLLTLYEATGEERWYSGAIELAEAILTRFSDPDGGFFDTPEDGEALVLRPRTTQDNAVPSGGAMATTVLLRLAALHGDERYRASALAALARMTELPARYPTAFAQWLCALELAAKGITEVALVGVPGDAGLGDLLAVADAGYHPFRVLARSDTPEGSAVPLLRGRFALAGRATAFVCRDFACRQPVHEPEALQALLLEGGS
jgi:uncharacterized protein YyaL (SSP411 family)